MLAPNTLLQDRYLVMRLLGQGGMGAVYQATDQKFGNAVALKETFYSDANLRKAFSHEARLLNRLRHAALPVVTDYFAISDKQFLVMQYIPGKDLEQLLHERKSSGQGLFLTSQVTKWADQLLDALEYLHSQKPAIIHRDIKPQNLKLTPRGEVILLDFGLAKGIVTHQSHESQSIRGYTPNYAPLEQIRGTGTDARSDIYSMGATLYHLLTGEMPPDALTRIASILMGQPDPLKQIGKVNPEAPPMVAAVIDKAMAPHPDQRYESAAMMRHALRNATQNIPPVSLHRETTLTDEPMRKDAVAATALLTGQLPVAQTEVFQRPAPTPKPGDQQPQNQDHMIILLEEAKQKLAGKRQEVLEKKQAPKAKPRPPRNEPVRATLDAPPSQPVKRAVTLTGSRSRAIRYGVMAMVVALLTIGIAAYRERATGQKLFASPPLLWNGTEARMDKPIPIRLEALRYYLEITQSGSDTTRDTGLEPLQAGSKFKFHFKPRDGGYLYIIAMGKNGSPQTFLTAQPMPSSGVTSNWTDGGKDYQFPDGGQWFMIQQEAEATPFTVIFSPYQLQAPKFLRAPSGKELSREEQEELNAFRARFGPNKHELVAVADGTQPAVTVQVPSDLPTPEPVMFDLALKRK
ncbi:MAG: protein kinase domain-containing protein [Blastocatellia bacterium]